MQAAPAQVPCLPVSLQYMEKLSQLAYHPLKMQSCYEKMEPLRLDGLQQRFDVSSTSVFKQRAQIHMREVGPRLLPQHTPTPCSAHTAFHSPHSWASHSQAQPRVLSPALILRPLPSARNTCLSIHLANWTHLSGLGLKTPSPGKPSLLPKPFSTGPRTPVSLRQGRPQCPARARTQ